MALPVWQRTIVTEAGDVVSGAEIDVVLESTGTAATIYSDRAGTTPESNPFFTGSDGFAQFYADAGAYRITATGPSGSITWRYEVLIDPTTDTSMSGKLTLTGGADLDGQDVDGDITFTGDNTFSGDNQYSGDNEYTANVIIGDRWVNGDVIGAVKAIPGNYIPPSAGFPVVCLTDFTGTKTISATNYPDITKPSGGTVDSIITHLRAQKLIYLEELGGEASTFAGTASGSVVTLTAAVTANEDLAAGLAEWYADMGAYPAVVISGTTYEVTDVDSVTLEITLGAAPGDGAVTLEVYPHRIAGSTTTARLWSWVGKTAIGAGTTETLAMMMRRDQMQGHAASVSRRKKDIVSTTPEITDIEMARASEGRGKNVPEGFELVTDGTNGTPRTGTTTHSPDVAVHWYMWTGVVTGL